MLRVENLSLRFGGVQALDGVGFALAASEALGLIGPNGSGKSTLFDTICGLVAPATGRILLDGEEITAQPTHRIARLGVARTFQGVRLFERMTARQNVHAAQPAQTPEWDTTGQHPGRGDVEKSGDAGRLLEFVGILPFADTLAEDLPLGARRRLELARALARRPRLLLLDEPAGAMTDAETTQMAQLLQAVHATGCAMIVVEHRVELIAAVCRRVVALESGRLIAEGTPEAVLADARVRSAYLGVAT
jgi:branched-chain amino acid transport system ATP-binding protein